MDGIGHGGWISDSPAQGDRLVEAVRGLRREVADIGRLEKLPCPTAMRGVVVPTVGKQDCNRKGSESAVSGRVRSESLQVCVPACVPVVNEMEHYVR